MKQHYETYGEMEKNARPDYELALDDIFENAWRDRNENYGDERKQAKYKAREAILTNWNNHDRTRKPTMRINPLWFIGVWMLWEETIGRTLDGEQRAAR